MFRCARTIATLSAVLISTWIVSLFRQYMCWLMVGGPAFHWMSSGTIRLSVYTLAAAVIALGLFAIAKSGCLGAGVASLLIVAAVRFGLAWFYYHAFADSSVTLPLPRLLYICSMAAWILIISLLLGDGFEQEVRA
jgi:hypothetical protein